MGRRKKQATLTPAGTVGVMTVSVTMDRAARRYAQIAGLEQALAITEAEIKDAVQHVVDARAMVKELREKESTLWVELRAVAQDKGDLPLFAFLAEEDAAGTLPVEPDLNPDGEVRP